MLYLVGETIDAKRAHQWARVGKLVQLIRGVYVEAEADVEAVVLGHAVRIAHYLYPRAYLSSASAVLLGPALDGRLFISGQRNQHTRLRTLEIVQNKAPVHPSTVSVVVGDASGELHMDASSPRQRFLEAFRLRSEHASAVAEPMRRQMAARLVEEFGSPQAAADALWSFVRENNWHREGEKAERYLLERPSTDKIKGNQAVLAFVVAWHGLLLGRLMHDGFEWRWKPARQSGPPLVRETVPGKLPPFIESLLPEGWLATVLHSRDERDMLRSGKRYLSNIVIVDSQAELKELPADVLCGALEDFSCHGVFAGRYAGPAKGELEETFEQNLARLFSKAQTPRLSGVQIKAPMCLTSDGALVPAIDQPFTHILKPAGTAGFEILPMVEWLCLTIGQMTGFKVPAFALVDMPNGVPPALVVERFDIRREPNDDRMLAVEDFCSVLGLPASAKYDSTVERVARGLRSLSTDSEADLEVLFRRALYAWFIADGDMHLKNLALLKTAEPGSRQFDSVRFAPLYDTVTTRVFPGLATDRMALKLNGKDDRLRPRDFLTLANTIGLSVTRAESAISELSTKLEKVMQVIVLPEAVAGQQKTVEEIGKIVAERIGVFL